MPDIFDLFKKIEHSPAATLSPFEWVVAGLGNPGREYDGTRHNMGFDVLNFYSKRQGFKIDSIRFKSYCGEHFVDGKRVLFLKPTTFMNLSGDAVREAMNFYKLPPNRLIVISDDVNLPAGKLRIRTKGSAGGHNGLKDIIYKLGSEDFIRIRVGVGEKPNPEYDMGDWVLGRIGGEDRENVINACTMASDAIPYI
ncbi:MAG: aminoacyl-tRNA hydrolase, partial [Oscillospiraceae bacterium]